MSRKLIFLLFALFFRLFCYAQVFENLQPQNGQFSKIAISKFPILSSNKLGTVFYNIKPSFFDSAIYKVMINKYNNIRADFEKYCFINDKYRYLDYSLKTSKLYYKKINLTTIKDSLIVQLYAKRFKKKWSWRKFKKILIFVDTVKVYDGSFIHNISLGGDKISKDTVGFAKSSITYNFKNILTNDHFTRVINEVIPETSLDLNDKLLNDVGVLHYLDKSTFYLKYIDEGEDFILYINLRFLPAPPN